MINATNLHRFFGDFHAVRGISLEVPPGEVLALLGPNGAGKSTTIRMLTGMVRPSRGTAFVAGYDVAREPQHVRSCVGLLTEYSGLYGRMKAMDYLVFFGRLHDLTRSDSTRRAEQLLRRFDLWEARDRRIGSYSKGMQQKIALIRAMLHEPQVLFLDEPTSAMDPASADVVRAAIRDLRDERRVIVLCTHDLGEAEALADRIAILRSGQLAACGTAGEITHRFLGDPLWEVELAQPLDRPIKQLQTIVALQQLSAERLRYHAADPRHVNPVVLEQLQAAGQRVVALREVPQSLHDVYLQVVGTAPPPVNSSTQPLRARAWKAAL